MKRIICCIFVLSIFFPLSVPADEEVEINLDALDDAPGTAETTDTAEPLLPVIVPAEIEKDPLWISAALAILIPAAAMLFPTKKNKTEQPKESAGNEAPPKKEI